MVLNYIWIAFFFIAFVVGLVRLVCFGDFEVFPDMMNATFDTARSAFEISIGLTGALALWLGVMKVGERGGVVAGLARLLGPVFARLFPDIPKGHPVVGNIFMNLSANMLGLDNAATPLGLKAMEGLQELNPRKDTASNPMIMFLVLNTSGLTIVPVGILVYRARMGAAQPTDVFVPLLIATFCSTLAGIVVTAAAQRINLLNRTLLLALGGLSLFMAALVWGFARLDGPVMNLVGTTTANVLLFLIIVLFIAAGVVRRVNVYDAFVEGAKEGFSTAVRIIPYLVAVLVAIGVFRASGAMDWLIAGLRSLVAALGCATEWVASMPCALMRPLSGSGARGLMVDAMQTYGPDSFTGRLCSVLQGSTDTTFYVLAVYFGSVGVRHTRHAVPCGLLADLAGVVAAILVCYLFFG